jgi:hypothetical protein
MGVYHGSILTELLDVKDNIGKCVICIGIPYPDFGNPKVELKRMYLDSVKQDCGLSGQSWYN